jgi:hypothetical protein
MIQVISDAGNAFVNNMTIIQFKQFYPDAIITTMGELYIICTICFILGFICRPMGKMVKNKFMKGRK